MGQQPSEIKKNIERAIREGVEKEYLDIVKELKSTYYLEDIAAAALAICAQQESPERVRRRTLHDVSFVPLMTGEAKAAGEMKKPTQHPARPVAVRKSLHGSQKPQGGERPQGGQRSRGGQRSHGGERSQGRPQGGQGTPASQRPQGGQRGPGGERHQGGQRPQSGQRGQGSQAGPRGPPNTGAPEHSGQKRRR